LKLGKLAFGLALGITLGLAILIATLWIVIAKGEGVHIILLSRFYPGYSVTVGGAFIGFVWGFIDGFIAGWLIALLYNLFSKKD